MTGLTGWKRALWTLGVVALWGFLGAMAAYEWDFWSLDTEGWKTVATGVAAAVGMYATNWLAPWITQYGIGKE